MIRSNFGEQVIDLAPFRLTPKRSPNHPNLTELAIPDKTRPRSVELAPHLAELKPILAQLGQNLASARFGLDATKTLCRQIVARV